MPPINKNATEEHRRAQQRLCKKRKYLEIKNDPELLAIEQEKRRNKHKKRKEEGKIKSIKKRTPRAQREQRKKRKENSKKYRQMKKQEETTAMPPFEPVLIEAAEDDKTDGVKIEGQIKTERQHDPLHQMSPAIKAVVRRREFSALHGTSHTPTALAEELKRIVQKWNIEGKILLAVSDNGANIKCAIEKYLGWKHFNCYLNLVVYKALEHEKITNIIDNAKAIVAYLKKSNVAWEKLKRYLEQAGKPIKRPLQEVPTRFNSKYYMLERLLELKDEINSALSNLNASVPILSAHDWDIIQKLLLVL
ncbi:unnamed protein product [Diatraea saccharalis]|uniref:Uncharacterized protein n=1 Tax=Diatraea saccharalis TaxID=40085 RepID=A0A9N9WDT1_9NEOP|nr:unnamed protein product [Diatraea saccharalis]